jgi:nuclear autoantigenic sperm protein
MYFVALLDIDIVLLLGESSNGKDHGDGNGEIEKDDDDDDDDDEKMGDEEESDLDLSWKMLDIARAIAEKSPDNTMEKVKIYSALGEVALERGSHSFLMLQSCT